MPKNSGGGFDLPDDPKELNARLAEMNDAELSELLTKLGACRGGSCAQQGNCILRYYSRLLGLCYEALGYRCIYGRNRILLPEPA